jgi:tRNA modification GTPase
VVETTTPFEDSGRATHPLEKKPNLVICRSMPNSLIKFAILTPPGTAAVATVAVGGERAWQLVRKLFRPTGAQSLPPQPVGEHFWYGHFGAPPGDAVIVAGHESMVEIHCHGGPQAVRWISDELTRHGGSAASAEALFGTPNLRMLATAELGRATTLRTAAILLDQMNGAFRAAIAAIVDALAAGEIPRDQFDSLARHASLGRHLTRSWRVAIAGAPNVGKSSLINALTGYTRSVVTATPGTTRDVVSTPAAIDGWPVELIDTAGQHAAADELEEQGIARGRAAIAAADLCLWVLDGSAPPAWPDPAPAVCIFVINKSDLPAGFDWDIANAVVVSARTGAGIAALCDRISNALVPEPPLPGAAVPFTPELSDMIAAADATTDDLAAAIAPLVKLL